MTTMQPISGDKVDAKPVSSLRGEWSSTRRGIILLSPIVVLIICQVTARLFGPVFGNNAIYPWLLVYWLATGGLIVWGGGREAIRRWAGPPRSAWGWSAIAFVFVPLAFYTALPAWRFLATGWLWLPWLIFPLFNASIEEGYWRGLLLDAGKLWPGWAIIVYTALFFGLNHASLGIFVLAERSLVPILFQVVFGLVMGLVYWKTLSLRWVVIGHALVNWLGLSMVMLLNLYIPG